MKKIVFALMLAFAATACYDDSSLLEEMNDLKETVGGFDGRLTELEEAFATLQLNVDGMTTLAKALKEGKFVVSCEPLADGTGYLVTFNDGTNVALKHGNKGETGEAGTDGEKGEDGATPTVTVKKNDKGVLCWYVNDEEVCPVYEAAPKFTSVDGNLYVTYPNETDPVLVGTLTGKSIFDSVVVDEENGTVTFTFIGEDGKAGESFVVTITTFSLEIKDVVGLQNNATAVEVAYTVKGANDKTVVDVIAFGCSAVVDAENSVIKVTEITDNAQLLVFADNGEGKTSIKKVIFDAEKYSVEEVTEVIPAAGGEVEVKGVSNVDFTVVIAEEATWLTQLDVKSAFTLTFVAEANPTTEPRSAKVSFIRTGTEQELMNVTLTQEAGTGEEPGEEPGEDPGDVEPAGFATRVWGKYSFFDATEEVVNWWAADGFNTFDHRNFAMDDEFVYVVHSSNEDPAIRKYSLADGSYAGNLDITGMTKGTHPVSVLKMVKNTDVTVNGGKDILTACNLTTDGADLQIWAWENGVDAAPVQKYTLGAARRFGDKMSFSGTWQSGKFWFRSNQPGDALVANIPITNGSVQTWIDPYRMACDDFQCMSDVFWYPQENGDVADYCLIGTNSSTALYLMSGTSAAGAGVVNTKYENLKNTLGVNFFEYNGTKYMAFVSMADGGGKPRLQIIEADGSSLETLKAGLDLYPTNVVFEAPLQDANDFTVKGPAGDGVNADCAVRVINGKVYIAALTWRTGLSVFVLN